MVLLIRLHVVLNPPISLQSPFPVSLKQTLVLHWILHQRHGKNCAAETCRLMIV